MCSRAVVLGGGLGGIFAATALATSFDEVLVVEKDTLDDGAARRGVPHRRQLHNLLSVALDGLDRLLPGVREEMGDACDTLGNVSEDTYVYEHGVRMPQRDLGLRIMSVDRVELERIARAALVENQRVTVRSGLTCTGLDIVGGAVTGAWLDDATGRRSRVEARVVVDALGATSPVESWTALHGHPVEVWRRSSKRWYATSHRTDVDHAPPSPFLMVFPDHQSPRSGLASPVGGGSYFVSLSGLANDPIPRDEPELREFAGSLGDRCVAELLQASNPSDPTTVFHRREAMWRRFDLASPAVIGLFPIGDAFATLDPLLGQGVSVLAAQAMVLTDLFFRGDGGWSVERSTEDYLVAAAGIVARSWTLAEPATAGVGWAALASDPFAASELQRALASDPELHRRYVGLWHLREAPSVLDQLWSPPTPAACRSVRP